MEAYSNIWAAELYPSNSSDDMAGREDGLFSENPLSYTMDVWLLFGGENPYSCLIKELGKKVGYRRRLSIWMLLDPSFKL